ncbi:MAG: 2,3-bisphosphoglycerate-independent phosphoglycerate mutase [Aliidongia sp.]
MTAHSPPRPVVLCILDGWGYLPDGPSNAIRLAKTPNWDRLTAASPHSTIEASERNVGLPGGQMGNSEVGHMNLGAGRVVMQELPRIDQAIADGSLAANPALGGFIAALKKSGGTAHLLGLLSPGGVHSHQRHIAALAGIIAEAGVKVLIHAFLDGRDTPPQSALGFLADFAAERPGVRFATVTGRYYAMDRDNRWDRVERAYRALVLGEGAGAATPEAAVAASYEAGVTDEFTVPAVIGAYDGMKDGDGVLMGNFRADRARELLTALVDPHFDKFDRPRPVRFAAALGIAEYSDELNRFVETIFTPDRLSGTFGETVSKAGLTQLRIAETEKYAHVTFFFNGGRETPFPGEERILVPSPKVATYDLQPEMSAFEVTDKLVAAIDSGKFDAIVVNFANPDMVGHSGIMAAAIAAVEAIDTCLGRVADAVIRAGGTLLITADHGNIEQMTDPVTGALHTAHTTNPVPVVLVNPPAGIGRLSHGRLADIAPTLLALLGIAQPAAMTGQSLMVAAGRHRASA